MARGLIIIEREFDEWVVFGEGVGIDLALLKECHFYFGGGVYVVVDRLER